MLYIPFFSLVLMSSSIKTSLCCTEKSVRGIMALAEALKAVLAIVKGSPMEISICGLCLILISFVIFLHRLQPVNSSLLWFKSPWKLPPGPKGYPVIGNLFDYLRDPNAVSHNELKHMRHTLMRCHSLQTLPPLAR